MTGQYTNLCNHSLLTSDEQIHVDNAERRENLKTVNLPKILPAPRQELPTNEPTLRAETKMIYVLHVYNKDGVYTSTAATEKRALQDLVAYIKKKWVIAFPGKPVLANEDVLIDQFFERVGAKEEFEILELPLL